MSGYNPLRAPHLLSGSKSLNDFSGGADVAIFSVGSPKMRPLSSSTTELPIGEGFERSGDNTVDDKGSYKEMKKAWSGALRDCKRSDPENTGYINRNAFIAALDRAAAETVMLQNVLLSTTYSLCYAGHECGGNEQTCI